MGENAVEHFFSDLFQAGNAQVTAQCWIPITGSGNHYAAFSSGPSFLRVTEGWEDFMSQFVLLFCCCMLHLIACLWCCWAFTGTIWNKAGVRVLAQPLLPLSWSTLLDSGSGKGKDLLPTNVRWGCACKMWGERYLWDPQGQNRPWWMLRSYTTCRCLVAFISNFQEVSRRCWVSASVMSTCSRAVAPGFRQRSSYRRLSSLWKM